MASGQNVNLHLIGKQGSGKSATGNSIIKERIFKSRSIDSPSHAILPVTQGQRVNFNLCVWDWPGTDGTQDQSQTIAKELRKINQDLDHNIHLFEWVIRYGELCDQEHEEFFQFLISELVEDFLPKRTIVIVTCIDNFDRDVEEIQLIFDKWKDQQTGFFENLCKMCNNRVLSFIINRSPYLRIIDLIWKLASNLPEGVKNHHLSSDRYTSAADKPYSSKLSRESETALRTADDRSESKLHTHSPESVEYKDWRMLLKSDIDFLINILTYATGREKISALQSLLHEVQSRQDKVGEKIPALLEER